MTRQMVETLREPRCCRLGLVRVRRCGGSRGARYRLIRCGWMATPITLPVRTRRKEQLQQQGIFDQVAEHIRREPVQSTRLLEAWIGSQEEMD